MKTRRRTRMVYLDGLDERIREEVLQDRIEGTRDALVMGLEPRRWGQIALLFAGDRGGHDVLYCFARGLNIRRAAVYLGISERTAKNVAHRYIAKIQALKDGAGVAQDQLFDRHADDTDDFQFAPPPRVPTRRGRPRKTAEAETAQAELCF